MALSACNLGHWKYDTVDFGDLTDASAILSHMRDNITEFGFAWMEHLNPAEALTQVKRYGEDAYCERIWMEDYEAVLNRVNARSEMPSIP